MKIFEVSDWKPIRDVYLVHHEWDRPVKAWRGKTEYDSKMAWALFGTKYPNATYGHNLPDLGVSRMMKYWKSIAKEKGYRVHFPDDEQENGL